MKIDKPSKPLPTSPAGEGAAHAAARGKGKGSTPISSQQSGSTSVSLGSTTAKLQSMESSMANSPIADAGKVSEIRQAISEGRFKVNSEIVADRLIETVKDLISKKT